MQLKKRSDTGYWYIYFSRTRRKSLRTKDRIIAKELFDQAKADDKKARILLLEKKRTITLVEFAGEYKRLRELHDVSDGARDNDVLAFRKFIEMVGSMPLRTIDRQIIDEFKAGMLRLGRSKSYINILLRSLRGAFSHAVESSYLDRNPFNKQQGKPPILFRIDDELPRFLRPEEIDRLFDTINDEDFLFMLRLDLYTGLRRSEILRLTWHDIDMSQGCIYVKRTKGKRDRVVPIADELLGTLKERHRDMGPVFPRWRSADAISALFGKYARKAGLVGIRLHDLRHTFGSYLAMKGVDLRRIKDLMGHSDINTTLRYAKLTQNHLREAVNKLSWK